jgi:hypothetical protein
MLGAEWARRTGFYSRPLQPIEHRAPSQSGVALRFPPHSMTHLACRTVPEGQQPSWTAMARQQPRHRFRGGNADSRRQSAELRQYRLTLTRTKAASPARSSATSESAVVVPTLPAHSMTSSDGRELFEHPHPPWTAVASEARHRISALPIDRGAERATERGSGACIPRCVRPSNHCCTRE